jgi:hypothetical protein
MKNEDRVREGAERAEHDNAGAIVWKRSTINKGCPSRLHSTIYPFHRRSNAPRAVPFVELRRARQSSRMAQMNETSQSWSVEKRDCMRCDGSQLRLVICIRDITSEPWFAWNNNYKSLDETPRLDRDG